ncbi:MAG: TIGR02594 family protein [Sphingobacteriia bacterium]|nr:TIGR02594 family protein [Sphingobacteriia bacterium]
MSPPPSILPNGLPSITVPAPVINPPVPKTVQTPLPSLSSSSVPWMNTAKSQIGVGETTGHNDGPDVDKYLKTVGLAGSGQPWCGAFVNWTLKQNGIKGTQKPAWALDWRNFGQSLSNPAFGSIATLKRPGGGHVGFTAATDADRSGWIIVLGGNQSDHVNYRSYPKSILKFNYPQNFTPSYNLPSMSGIPKGIRMQ